MTEKMLKEYTVRIETVESEEEIEIGTGFFIEKNRIATCYHVIANSKDIKIFWKGNQYVAKVLDKDKKNDVAVLEAYINNEKFVEIDEEIESKNGYFCYGFPESDNDEDDEIFGEPLSFNGESKKIKTGDGLYKFKDGNFQSGYSGSAILNLDTGKVCAIVKYSRDIHTDLGGKGIPISKLNLLDYGEKQLDEKLYLSVPNNQQSEYIPREKDMRKIKELLLKKNQNIGLYGMGGIGKSIFVKALGLDDEVKRYFKDGIYFIQLGQNPSIEEIQVELLSYLDIENFDFITNKREIKIFFSTKKALLIIDDVWDIKDIDSFAIQGKEAKILITTRQKDIVNAMDAKSYSIDLLSKQQSLSLLEKKLGKKVEDNLSPLSKEILERCRYLPLAINIIGNILKGKDKEYWENVLGKLEGSKLEKLKYKTTNEQHENLFKVIDLSVNYLDSEYKDKYLSLNVFNSIKSIPRVTLKIYWGEDYLDIIDELINASLLFEDNIRGKILYHVHDLQVDYVKSMDNGDYNYKKRIRKEYKSKYADRWSDIDIKDSYFYNNYQNIFKEKDVKEISNHLLYNQTNLSLAMTKKIILDLKLDKKLVGLELLNKNRHPETLIWILNILEEQIEEVQEFTKSYIRRKSEDSHIGLIIKCLNILDNTLEEVQEFAIKYIEQKFDNLDAGITIKCLDILGSDKDEVQNFSKNYIQKDINTLDGIIILKCLSILKNDLIEIKEFTKKYILQDIGNIHADLILKCMNILGNHSNEVQNFVTKYLKEDIEKVSPALMIKSLDILEQEPSKVNSFVIRYIQIIIEEDFSSFDNGLAIKCLNIIANDLEKIQKEFAKKYIEKNITLSNSYDSRLIIKCLKILDNSLEEVKLFSKRYIQKDIRKNNELLIQCLEISGKNSEEVQFFAKKYLEKEKVNMRVFLECINILDIDLEEVKNFNSIKKDNNLIQKYINIFLRYDVKKYKLNIDKISFSKYFKLLSISPKELYVMLYHEHKIYMFNKDLGDYARYCNKHKESEVRLRGISKEEIYEQYHYRAYLLFEIMADFYLNHKNLDYPNNILSNILKSIDKKLVYKKEIEKLFFDEINNKNSDMREKSIVDLANYYNDIKENEKAMNTISLGIEINLIQSDMFINYAQNALITAFYKSYRIKNIMGEKYNKNTYKMKQLLKKEDRKRQ